MKTKIAILFVIYAVSLSSCRLLRIPEAVDTSTPTAPTAEPTKPPTATIELTKTPTETVVPTPEIVAADPTNIESWPSWAQDFFLNHPEDASQDARFQELMDLSRRQHLIEAGVAGVEEMSSEELMRYMIKQSAIEQHTVVLTPAEIISMITDHGDWMRPHVDPPNGALAWAWYDIFNGVSLIRDITVAPSPTIDENAFEEYMNYSYPSTIFGRNTEVPVFPANSVRVDFAGVIELPGGGERRGILMRYLGASEGVHYRVYRVLNEPTTFDSSNYCIVGERVNCPYTLEGGGIKIWGWTPETRIGNIETAPRHPAEDLPPYLGWPPNNSTLVMLSKIAFANPAVFAVIDPETGLLVADFIEIYSQEQFATRP